jgi:hypothetical protein
MRLEYEQPVVKSPDPDLADKYSHLFNTNAFSDFACISFDNKVFPVHHTILSEVTPTFHAMLNSQMIENGSNMARVDVNGVVLHEILRFIYTGSVENIERHASQLLLAAEEYKMRELMDLCVWTLIKNLSEFNIFPTFTLADRCSNKLLYYECINFIKR